MCFCAHFACNVIQAAIAHNVYTCIVYVMCCCVLACLTLSIIEEYIYIYIYIYVCMYVCMYVCIYIACNMHTYIVYANMYLCNFVSH